MVESYPAEAAQPLAEAVAGLHYDDNFVEICLCLLTNLRADSLAEHALLLLQDEKAAHMVRHAATHYLGAIRYFPSFEPMVLQAQNGTGSLRNAAILELGSFGGQKVIQTLTEILDKGDGISDAMRPFERFDDIRLYAAESLAKMSDARAIDSLQSAISGGSKRAKLAALNALKEFRPETSIEVFEALLNDAEPNIVCIAIEGLQESKSPNVVELLLPLLEHSVDRIRTSSARAIEQSPLGANGNKVAGVLLRSKDEKVVAACSKSLLAADWQHAQAVTLLSKKLRSSAGDQYDFIALLRHLANEPMGPKDVNEFSNDPEGWVKKWSEWAAHQ
jgi:HEAT repeat protein